MVLASALSQVAAVTLSALSAAVFVAAMALQQRANLEQLREAAAGARPGAAVAVVRRPAWIAGFALSNAGFVIHAVALGLGALSLVQPILVSQLVFMVPAGAWVVGSRPRRSEWSAALVVSAGLAGFVAVTRAEEGLESAPAGAWGPPLLVLVVVFTALLATGWRLQPLRAALFGAATGLWSAALGAFVKQLVGEGIRFDRWAVYAVVTAGILNIVWMNLAVRAGRLSSAVGLIVVTQTLTALALGWWVFDETVDLSPASALVAGAALALIGAGAVRLARSPSLLALDATPDSGILEPRRRPPG